MGETAGPEEVLDARVCECCQTAAAMTKEGPVVVYRGRSPEEIRDIRIVRRAGQSWASPSRVHADEWIVPGCPVNGPSIAAGERVELLAVAWFTAAGNRPLVQVAFSRDAGGSFEPPVPVDVEAPLGRVGVILDEAGDAIVMWLAGDAADPGRAEIRLRRVAPSGALGQPLILASTSPARASGFPRIARLGKDLVAAWTEAGEATRLRAARLPIASVPRTGSGREAWKPDGDAREIQGTGMAAYSARTLDGDEVALASAYRGEAVLLNVWATWCLPCREEAPVLIAIHERYADEGLRVIGISVDEAGAAARVRRFVEQAAIPFGILHDPEDRISRALGLSSLPATFLLDGEGSVVWSRRGQIQRDDEELAAAIRGVLGARTKIDEP